jgi:hypothetical protein
VTRGVQCDDICGWGLLHLSHPTLPVLVGTSRSCHEPTLACLIAGPLLRVLRAETFEGEHHRADETGWIKILFEGAAQLARDAVLDQS